MKQYQLLLSAGIAWALTQTIKAIINWIETKEFSFERLFGNGGMPSSHSATVCSFSTTCLIKYGFDSFEFAISALFSIVVIADAMGVRLETGKQAKLLNAIIEDNFLRFKDIVDPEQRFKEFVGHTPFQVLVGSILGIIVALLLNLACK